MRSRKFPGSLQTLIISSVLAILIFSGCQKPTINFGTPFIDNNTTKIVVVDTFSAYMSTVTVDSFGSAGTGMLMIGRYKDDYTGVITGKTYLQVSPPFNPPVISNQAGFDSMSLILRLNKYSYGDTTKSMRFVVSQLQEIINYPGLQKTFYSNDSIPYDPNPMGYTDVTVHPSVPYSSQLINDSVKIRLPDAKGLELFGMLQRRSDTTQNAPRFLAFFKGLAIYTGDNSIGAMYGFKDTVFMRVYYHETGVTLTPKFLDFRTYLTQYQFNQVSYDRTGTPLQGLSSVPVVTPGVPREISSDLTDDLGFVQSGTNLQVKIRFPYIWKLQQLPDFVSVLKAELVLKPIAGSYSPALPLPPGIQIYQTDEKNLLGFPIVLTGGQYGNLSVDYYYGANTNYSYDLTTFVKQQLAAGAENNAKDGVMLVLPAPAYNTTMNRAVIGDRKNPLNRAVLKIYYASFY